MQQTHESKQASKWPSLVSPSKFATYVIQQHKLLGFYFSQFLHFDYIWMLFTRYTLLMFLLFTLKTLNPKKPFHVSIVYKCDAKIIPCWVCFPHSNIFVFVIGGEDWRGQASWVAYYYQVLTSSTSYFFLPSTDFNESTTTCKLAMSTSHNLGYVLA